MRDREVKSEAEKRRVRQKGVVSFKDAQNDTERRAVM